MSEKELVSQDQIRRRSQLKKCDYCGKVLSKQHMSRHVNTFHRVKVPSICVTCKKEFSNKDLLNVHIKRDHSDQKFDCKDCSRSFNSPSLLTRHKLNNKEKKIHLARCPKCCQRFLSTKEYNKHISKACGGTLAPETSMDQGSTEMGPPLVVPKKRNPPKQSSNPIVVDTKNQSKRRMTTKGKSPVHTMEIEDDVDVVPQSQDEYTPDPPTAKKARVDDQEDEDFLFQTQQTLSETNQDAAGSINEDDEQPASFEQSQVVNQSSSSTAEEPPMDSENNSIVGSSRRRLTQLMADSESKFEYLLFLFEIWGLTKDEETLDKTMSSLSVDDDSVLNVLTTFLQGKLDTYSAIEFESFLQRNPEKLFGHFLRAVMVVDFCLKSPMLEVMKLLELCLEHDMDCVDLVSYTAAFILQRAMRIDRTSLDGLLEIPEKIAQLVVHDLQTNSSQEIYTCSEIELLMEVRQLLGDAIDLDEAVVSKPLLFATEKAFKTIRAAWSNIATIMTTPRVSVTTNSWTELIIKRDLERHITTKPYFTVVVNNTRKSVHLHEGIVNIFSTLVPRKNQTVWGKQSDVDVFIKLLYQINSPFSWIPNVTTPLFDMATILEIGDMWKFLYRGHSIDKIWETQENKFVLIRNIIKLKVPGILISLRQHFIDFCKVTGYGVLSEVFNFEEIISIVTEMKIEGMELYYFILEYSYFACGLNSYDKNHIKRVDEVAVVFNNLCPSFKLDNVPREELTTLLKHRYVPLKDILKAMGNTLL